MNKKKMKEIRLEHERIEKEKARQRKIDSAKIRLLSERFGPDTGPSRQAIRTYEHWRRIGLDSEVAFRLAVAAWTNNAEYRRLKRLHKVW